MPSSSSVLADAAGAIVPVAPPDTVSTRALREYAVQLGISEIGVCRAEQYAGTEADIAERGARGLFADLKFTMARPHDSCHPESLIDDAHSVISAALSYWRPEPAIEDEPAMGGPGPDRARGRIARYTRDDAYEALRERLAVIAHWLEQRGHSARILIDSNYHVDREAAARSGVGFYGKNTVMITRRFGSWVVLGTIVTSAPLAPTEPLRPGCGDCTACIDACPTGALIEPGVLDVGSCISYWTQSRHDIPVATREVMEDMVYGCDICQQVCPWNRGAEKRQADREPALGHVDLVAWLELPDDQLNAEYERFFVPRRNIDFLRRNAVIAIANSGRQQDAALIAPLLDHRNAMLRELAVWALRRLGGDLARSALANLPSA